MTHEGFAINDWPTSASASGAWVRGPELDMYMEITRTRELSSYWERAGS